MTLMNRYPSLWHMAAQAKKRMPFFAWEYLDSGTGLERLLDRNGTALDNVHLTPRILSGRFEPHIATSLLGQDFSAPFGISPVGLSGLMWPGAEVFLAKTAATKNIPYGLSMVATESLEDIAQIAGENMWMQIYYPTQPEVLDDLLARCTAAGIKTLVITVDVPVNSTRERQVAAGLSVPPRTDWRTLLGVASRPAWAWATLRHGIPSFKTLNTYFPQDQMRDSAKLIGSLLDGRPDWQDWRRLRDAWDGNLILKGVMHHQDAEDALKYGADAIWVSNHGGRQFDASPAAIDALAEIAALVNRRVPVIFDSGIRSGLDVLRALSLGADFCFLGRGFLHAVAALGARGPDHAFEILTEDLRTNLIQINCRDIHALRGHT